jgi:hypothetical protein
MACEILKAFRKKNVFVICRVPPNIGISLHASNQIVANRFLSHHIAG